MNRKTMPLVLMLTAGAVTCVITYLKHYSVFGKLAALLAVLVIFYVLGTLLRFTLDHFERQNDEAREEEEKAAGEPPAEEEGEKEEEAGQ